MSCLRDQYAALDLGVLEQVSIPDTAWNALEKGLAGLGARDIENTLPVTVAGFQKEAADMAMDWARAQKKLQQNISPEKFPLLVDWKRDIEKIDTLFYGKGKTFFSSVAIGPFITSRGLVPLLHEDGGIKARVYVVRLNALPTLVMRQADIDALPEEEKKETEHLIKCAMGKDRAIDNADAKRILIEREILNPLPFGDVALLSGDTKHCSSTLEKNRTEPVYSAFFRVIRFSL